MGDFLDFRSLKIREEKDMLKYNPIMAHDLGVVHAFDIYNIGGGDNTNAKIEEQFEGICSENFDHYSARSFVKAEKKDLVVLSPNKKTESAVTALPYLQEAGIGPKDNNILFIGYDAKKNCLTDPDNALPVLTSKYPNSIIEPFSGMGAFAHEIARKTKLRVNSPHPLLVRKVNGKDYFQNLGFDCIPFGKCIYNLDQAISFFKENKQTVVVKSIHSASGLSSTIVSGDGTGVEDAINLVLEGKKIVIQKFFEHDVSPSVNLEINKDGKIEFLFTSSQILSISSNGTEIHEGNICFSGLSDDIEEYIIKQSIKICRRVVKTKYFGPIGVDWIVNYNNGDWKAWAVEINPRITAPRYPYEMNKKLGAKSFGFENMSFNPKYNARDIRNMLDNVYWNVSKKEGVLFYNFNGIDGKLIVCAFGKCQERVKELLKESKRILS